MDKKERHRIANKKWRDNNKEKEAIRNKKWRDNNNEYFKEYNQTSKGKKSMMINSWKQSGIIDEDLYAVYDYYVKETNCWICQNKFKDSRDRHLDHDHLSGEIRYICCRNCNTGLLREN